MLAKQIIIMFTKAIKTIITLALLLLFSPIIIVSAVASITFIYILAGCKVKIKSMNE